LTLPEFEVRVGDMNTYNFHTILNGRMRSCQIKGTSVRDAVATLRAGLYDGETIVGWR
jgi:hypothetical protein